MASGIPFDEEQYNLATQGKRNPGSAFKPITLLAALETGSQLYSHRDSRSPTEIDCGYPCAPVSSNSIRSTWISTINYTVIETPDLPLKLIVDIHVLLMELELIGL